MWPSFVYLVSHRQQQLVTSDLQWASHVSYEMPMTRNSTFGLYLRCLPSRSTDIQRRGKICHIAGLTSIRRPRESP